MLTLMEVLTFILVYYVIPCVVLILIVRGGRGVKQTPEQKREMAEFNAQKEPDWCYWDDGSGKVKRVFPYEYKKLEEKQRAKELQERVDELGRENYARYSAKWDRINNGSKERW